MEFPDADHPVGHREQQPAHGVQIVGNRAEVTMAAKTIM